MPTSSLAMRVAKFALRRRRGTTLTAEQLRGEYFGRDYPSPAAIPALVRQACSIREQRVGGRPVFVLTPKRAARDRHVLYTHGGAFVRPLLSAHWYLIDSLVRSTGATVTVPLYPLAPEHDHRAAFELLEVVYRDLLDRAAPERVVLCGDSAGGNLALGQALRYRDAGLPMPARVILFAPWLDLTMSNPEAAAIEPRDVMLRVAELVEYGRWWAGASDPAHPSLSPLFAELGSLPPIDVYQGTDDVFLPDARLLAERVRAANGAAALHETHAGFHVFMAATFTREARAVFGRIAADLRSVERPLPEAKHHR